MTPTIPKGATKVNKSKPWIKWGITLQLAETKPPTIIGYGGKPYIFQTRREAREFAKGENFSWRKECNWPMPKVVRIQISEL
jgi:hypothetical protein